MSKNSHLLQAVLFLVLFPSVAWIAPASDEVLKPSDHATLGKQIAGYISAKQNNKGIDKAQADLADELEKIKKRLKGRDPLSLTSDLGKSLWQAFSYETQKGVKRGKVAPMQATVPFYADDYVLDYALYAPAKYEPKRAYPLILAIPEKGVKPTDHLTEKWVSEALRDNAVLAAVPMPDDLSQWTATGSQGKPGGVGNLLTVMREVTRIYAIDFDRIYLAGRGEGVAAAVTIASRFPDRFAGIIGRAGDASETSVDNFRNLPTFFAGGGANATNFSDQVGKAGYANCTLKPEAQENDIWAWMQDHARVSNPVEVILVPGTPFPNKAYWVEVPPFDGQGKAIVKATADRSTNTINVEGEGVTSVSLFFNDTLVDMDKPIKIVCNGTEHVDVVPRNLATLLQLIVNSRSDPGKLYTATKIYDLPARSKLK